jgi:putative AdoMet-dependent methyltransferase
MRSRRADDFNHDPWAEGYDESVLDEADPIRSGYGETLEWVVGRAEITPDSVVVDLGAGTGNTAALIAAAKHVTCVDVSPKMMDLARPKLGHLKSLEYVVADVLEFLDVPRRFDRLVSTYAVHHLTEDEKAVLLQRIASSLVPSGLAVFGDLMFEDRAARDALARKYAGWPDVIESIEDEYFWYLGSAAEHAQAAGCVITDTRRFSDLSWGIRIERVL